MIHHRDVSRSERGPAAAGGACGAASSAACADHGATAGFPGANRTVGGCRRLDPRHRARARYHAANGQHMAHPLCRDGAGGAGRQAAAGWTGFGGEIRRDHRSAHSAQLDQPPPAGYARWTGGLLAAALGDVSDQYVWRFLRAQKIDLDGRKSWCVSHDPEFVAKSAEIVGLYLDPPAGALVLSVDEKPHIQALERAQGYLAEVLT